MSRRSRINDALVAELNKAAGRVEAEPIISFDEAVKAFVDSGIAKGLSDETVKSYDKELLQLRRHLIDIGSDISDICNLTTDDIESFKQAQLALGRARTTTNLRIRTTKIFGNFCVAKKMIAVNPAQDVEVLRVRHEVGPTFSQSQLRRILDAPNITTFEGVRDLAIMRTLADTGIRVSELAALNVSDVKFADKSLNVQRTKNRYARRVPLTRRLQSILSAYIRVRGHSDSTDALFITSVDTRLAVGSIQYQIRQHGKSSGVIDEIQCSPHVFRRTFAKFKVQAGTDIFTLQRLMGHSDINELRNYVAIYSTDLDESIEKGIDY